MPSCGIGLGLPYAGTGIDPDALSYFSRAGISSAAQTPTTFQNASTFSGTTQSLTVASNSTLQVGGSSFSFSCWFNPSVSAGPQTLIQKTVSGALEYSFGLGGTGQVRGLLGNAGSSWTFILDTPFYPSAGRWTQAVWTYDGTTLRIYINGSLSVSATGPAITTSGTAPLEIGRETGAAFNGSISSVGFWKRAISASEVTALFNSGSGRTYASLDSSIRTNMVSWWDLSETSGNRADSFGSNTLTNNNSVGTTSQGAVVTGTANSRALILDFVKGVKALGLWNNMVCWPLRSSQNAGTGTTAFSLGGLGTFNGTLVNGPTWGAGGITAAGTSSSYIFVPSYPVVTSNHSLFGVQTVSTGSSQGGFATVISTGGGTGALAGRLVLYGFTTIGSYISGTYFRPLTGGDTFRRAPESNLSYNTPRWRASSYRTDLSSISHIIDGTVLHDAAPAAGTGTLPFTDSNTGLNILVTQVSGVTNTSPFAGLSTGYLTATQHDALRNLYKSTLGVGLGLP